MLGQRHSIPSVKKHDSVAQLRACGSPALERNSAPQSEHTASPHTPCSAPCKQSVRFQQALQRILFCWHIGRREIMPTLYISSFPDAARTGAPGVVSITRFSPRWWNGPHYVPLLPTWNFRSVPRDRYEDLYAAQLASLDA